MYDKDSCYTCQSSELFENPVPYTDGINGGELCGYCNKNDGHYRIFLPGGKCKDFKSKEENEVSEELLEKTISDWTSYNPGSHKDIKKIIQDNINSVCANYVAIGYYLNIVNDRELYKEDGYSGIGEYAAAEYGIPKDRCSRLMKIAERFCIDNSPALLPEYRDFAISKLQEMVGLDDEKLKQVTLTTTRAEIREMKNPEPEKVVHAQLEPEPQRPSFKICKWDGKSNCVACSAACCGECRDHGHCNIECGWQGERIPKPVITEDDFIIGFYRHIYDSEKRLVQQRNIELLRTELIDNHGKRYESTNCILDGWTSCYPDKVVYRQDKQSTQMQLSWGKVVSRIFKLVDDGRIIIEPKIITKTIEPEPEYIESVTDEEDDSEELLCKGCQYNTMDPDEYHAEHPEARDFPCNRCDDKLSHWEPKTEKPSDDESLPCDTCGREIQGCCDYPDTQDDYCVEGDKWIPVPEESEVVETVEADIIQTVPEEQPKPMFSAEHHLREAIQKEEEQIEIMSDHWKEHHPDTLLKHQTILIALKCYLTEMEFAIEQLAEPVKTVQPELPILKNNDQRKDFIDAYEAWPIWIDQKETGERYYRYDLNDKIAMVVKVSRKHSFQGYKEAKDYEYGAEQYYLLGIKSEWHQTGVTYNEDGSRTFYECSSNKSALVDYLKYFQKKA